MNSKPETYWEKRCDINEGILDEIINVIATHLPSTQDSLYSLLGNWDMAIARIEEESN